MKAKTSIWPTCKTLKLKLGTGLKTADDFRKAIKASGQDIGHWGNDIIGNPDFKVANQETEVELVKATVRKLTGKNQAPTMRSVGAPKSVAGRSVLQKPVPSSVCNTRTNRLGNGSRSQWSLSQTRMAPLGYSP